MHSFEFRHGAPSIMHFLKDWKFIGFKEKKKMGTLASFDKSFSHVCISVMSPVEIIYREEIFEH